ncbi:hypothetical protein [Microlunatus antarcticus]|uniref:Uncharacterized protein n=1 Tax=Microlunatus antarcticus TaxID=53388 RepID=A0A7W5P7W4_9ACTN|nr:hypothetical protein [Microlunatus antarcticus]MBB3327953.1 hypothetical protein [Microlunatus antarcticus]
MSGSDVDVRPISRGSLAWRVFAAIVLVVLLVHGSTSLAVKDDAWPLGPLSQYAFRPGPNDTVLVTRTYGLMPDGSRIELPLRVETAGISRAEVEAQIPRFERDPSLLRAVSDGWSSRHPDQPRPVEVLLVQDRSYLHKGRVVSRDEVPLAQWRVTP